MKLDTILFATDYDEPSQEALRYAAELAHDYKARLIVLHAVPTLGPENVSYGEATTGQQPEAFRKRLWEELHQIRPPDPNVPVEYVLSEESPVSAIIDLAGQRKCDLIVIGSHGRHGLRRFLEGSVAEHVVQLAPCPVLVVKNRVHGSKPSPAEETEFHPHFLAEPPSG
jgi:universal stress protein A